MINAQDIKIGTCIRMDGKLYFCIDFLHVKPGKGNTFMRTKLKDVVNGYVLERRFNIGENWKTYALNAALTNTSIRKVTTTCS